MMFGPIRGELEVADREADENSDPKIESTEETAVAS